MVLLDGPLLLPAPARSGYLRHVGCLLFSPLPALLSADTKTVCGADVIWLRPLGARCRD